jgi:hypothetical protein
MPSLLIIDCAKPHQCERSLPLKIITAVISDMDEKISLYFPDGLIGQNDFTDLILYGSTNNTSKMG